MSATESTILPRFRVVRIDVTEHYRDGAPHLIDQGGKLYDVYLYDDARRVHCCELTPSHELHYLYSTSERAPDDDEARERFNDELDEANRENDRVIYVHSVPKDECGNVEAWSPTEEEYSGILDEYGGNADDAYEAALEAQLEHERCNWRL